MKYRYILISIAISVLLGGCPPPSASLIVARKPYEANNYITHEGKFYRVDSVYSRSEFNQYLNDSTIARMELKLKNGKKIRLDSIQYVVGQENLLYFHGSDKYDPHPDDLNYLVLSSKIPFSEKIGGFAIQFGLWTLAGVVMGVPDKQNEKYDPDTIKNGMIIGTVLGSVYFLQDYREIKKFIVINQ